MQTTLTIHRPDDMHLHLRDGAMLRAVMPHSSKDFGRAIIMPNLVPPVVTTAMAETYRAEVLAAVPKGHDFTPMMTLYLTETTDPDDIELGASTGLIRAVKLYPAGATTNSDNGVHNIDKVIPALERMAQIGLPLLVHGEVTAPDVDIFDREAMFIETVLDPLRHRLPELRVVMEHVTTKDGIDYVTSASGDIAATLTTHHLVLNRNALLAGGIRPHYYCLPILKREEHRQALLAAAVSGNPRFFLGTDSAPHPTGAKESACGCAGVFSAPNSLSILASVFETENALEKLEAFTSLNGCSFYKLSPNPTKMRLVHKSDPVIWPSHISVEGDDVVVFDPGFNCYWHIEM